MDRSRRDRASRHSPLARSFQQINEAATGTSLGLCARRLVAALILDQYAPVAVPHWFRFRRTPQIHRLPGKKPNVAFADSRLGNVSAAPLLPDCRWMAFAVPPFNCRSGVCQGAALGGSLLRNRAIRFCISQPALAVAATNGGYRAFDRGMSADAFVYGALRN